MHTLPQGSGVMLTVEGLSKDGIGNRTSNSAIAVLGPHFPELVVAEVIQDGADHVRTSRRYSSSVGD
jgi:hypothetical protein